MRTGPRPLALFSATLLALVPLLVTLPSQARQPKETRPSGLLVLAVDPGTAGDRAGLKPGDVVSTYRWTPARGGSSRKGGFASPLDFQGTTTALLPQAPFTLEGTRAGQAMSWSYCDGDSGILFRPEFDPADAQAFEAALEAGPGAGAALLALADSLEKRRRPSEAAWLRLKAAEASLRARRPEEVPAALDQATASAKGALSPTAYGALLNQAGSMLVDAGEPAAAADVAKRAEAHWAVASPGAGHAAALALVGEVAFRKGDLDGAQASYRASSEAFAAEAPQCFMAARSWGRLGEVAWARGRLDEAQEHFQRAYDLVAQMAPGGIEMVAYSNNLGKVRFRLGDLAGAEAIYRAGVQTLERLQPDSLALARSLNGLGLILMDLGDLPEAERLLTRAVAIWKTQEPGNPNGWRPVSNLGNVYLARGDLIRAEACYRTSLEMVRRLAPGTLQESAILGNLAAVALNRQDLGTAEKLLGEVIAITEKAAPESPDLARAYQYLGDVKVEENRHEEAVLLFDRALDILRRKTPGSPQLGRTLLRVAGVCIDSGDLAKGQALAQEAYDLFQKSSPDSPDTAFALTALGWASAAAGDLPAASTRVDRAVALLSGEGKDPEGLVEALALQGEVRSATAGQRPLALESYRRALDLVEAMRETLGGTSEDQASFLAKYAEIYRAYEALLLEDGQTREAFRCAERLKATAFLRMLADRDLDFSADLSPELERERRRAAADLERARAALSAADGETAPGQLEALQGGVREARTRVEAVRAETLRRSKEVYALRYPEPFGADQALSALDPGTLLLEYSVGPKATYLYLLGPGPEEFSVLTLPVEAAALRRDVARFRQAIQEGVGNPAHAREEASLAVKLSTLLLKPAAARVTQARRLLIVPDGALHYLPFAALADPAKRPPRRGAPALLVESKPLHTAASATVYAQLLKSRRPPAPLTFEAFGDPAYGEGKAAAARGGDSLAPLPGTRQEVEFVRQALGEGRVFLGPEATPEAALAVPRGTRILHFACHGLTDEARPLDSALALSPGTRADGTPDDGLLDVWQVFEKLRVDADLVALSACDTGLGKYVEGEGLVGLTRAFQYAGARTVLSSLWPVGDTSTAQLMRNFYGNLRAGLPKDEALRRAQVALLKGEGAPPRGTPAPKGAATTSVSPWYWAAFQLVGDGR